MQHQASLPNRTTTIVINEKIGGAMSELIYNLQVKISILR
jgi:hypothetical protein